MQKKKQAVQYQMDREVFLPLQPCACSVICVCRCVESKPLEDVVTPPMLTLAALPHWVHMFASKRS